MTRFYRLGRSTKSRGKTRMRPQLLRLRGVSGGYGELEASSRDRNGCTLLKVYIGVRLVDIHRTEGQGQVIDLTIHGDGRGCRLPTIETFLVVRL